LWGGRGMRGPEAVNGFGRFDHHGRFESDVNEGTVR
jgi:hypothetical protein